MSEPPEPPIIRTPFELSAVGTETPTAQQPRDDAARPESSNGITGSRPLIFGMLFGVTGALGLPLLWYSPVFSRKEKWLWSIVNTLYTLGLIAIAIAALRVILDALNQL